ncbi:SusD/RagB family nutrient-binding outer membrane lipoprotein [Phocaeicola vulgatus]|jgi:hypothetical protein|uniref:SusD/RagB family nutrient-binding outer membrane lipoprotein n=1 Tax=Phocaeicola vulgatus TaxID=821 RepID=UPI001E5E329C|nr:SusD/RagB family nutrient-binding outer membrane lipoprotein [Phocaeicola vulgatus]MDB0795897.1 SusD/RagB family nutrient-binding outer membrane lipoprotein [Phocaeicola vulgatus]BDC05761.1 hypothetical protein GAIMETA21S03_16440 [Phocaeicola vulgatus]BDC09820.1 hypothetical protein GAIMETA21S07_16080 [Phocaeicola vulgatus]BDC13990.1 hypothetical protein GAIMETA21S10_17540 [Phocaeicola vulgatus]
MKKYILMAMSVALLGFTACSEDTLDDINKDNQHPSPDVVPAYLQLSEAIMSTGFSTVSGDLAFYLSSLNEQEIGVGNNQLMKAELRNSSEWAASTTFNNVWNSTYGNLMNIRQMQNKVKNEIPGNVGQYDILGIAQVLEALNFGILTDMHGDIPYSEAVQGQANLQPKLDKQKDVYEGILATLDDAIINLEKGADLGSAKDQDLLLGGKVKKWEAFAYALKARYILHKSVVENNVWSQVEAAATKAIELGFEGVAITEFNGVTCDNPWSAYIWSRSYVASSKTVTDLMKATNDPRLDYYTYGTGKSYAPGDENAAKVADGSLVFPQWYDDGSQPLHLFSKAELYFILAEAQLRQNKDATDAFQTAVKTAVSEIMTLFKDDTDVTAFVATLGTPTLQILFEQKYLAQSYDEQIEAYNDIRRCKAMGESYITLTNPFNTQSGINRYPERLPYGNSSVLSNPHIKAAYGDGTYIYTEKTWINGGK